MEVESATEMRRRLLREELRHTVRRMQWDERRYSSLGVIRTTGFIVGMMLLWRILQQSSESPAYMVILSGTLAAFSASKWASIRGRYKIGQQQHALVQELRDDVQSAGTLALIAHLDLAPEPAALARACLKGLLPRLRAGDADEFTQGYMDATLHLLNSDDGELVVATLKGLEQIGDNRALAPVARLAAQTRHLQVQAAAQECLPYVQARAQEQEKAATLLRPSDAAEVPPASLLRPATSHIQEAAPEQLLRPG